MKYRKQAISWVLHSMKILFGDESIRRYIIIKYNPLIENQAKKCIRTFSAFVQNGKSREDKAKQIIRFCDEMCLRKGTIVYTATNIQETPNDMETHFQTYIQNNETKQIIIIDPAFDNQNPGNEGIYMAQVSTEVIIPFFQQKNYSCHFLDLSSPAQICEGDVFCQSWSLFILIQKLKNNGYNTNLSFEIPFEQLEKYELLLAFYKQLFNDFPELRDNLITEYKAEILSSISLTNSQKEKLLIIDPIEILLSMTGGEMK